MLIIRSYRWLITLSTIFQSPAALAIALAIIVLPQPGGPCNKTPTSQMVILVKIYHLEHQL